MASENLNYTAKLYFNDNVIYVTQDDDLNKLIAELSELVEDQYRHADGEIIDNTNGKVVHRCRMVASD